MKRGEEIEDLVALIDQFMENGGNHMNVDTDPLQKGIQVDTKSYNECSTGKWATACAVPTLMEELEEEQELIQNTGGKKNDRK